MKTSTMQLCLCSIVILSLLTVLASSERPENGYLLQQGAQLTNGIGQFQRDGRSYPEEISAVPDYNDYLRVLTKRRMSKISCLKSCVGQHILHPMYDIKAMSLALLTGWIFYLPLAQTRTLVRQFLFAM